MGLQELYAGGCFAPDPTATGSDRMPYPDPPPGMYFGQAQYWDWVDQNYWSNQRHKRAIDWSHRSMPTPTPQPPTPAPTPLMARPLPAPPKAPDRYPVPRPGPSR